ncbi:MAG: hypothetical protein IJ514_03475 [Clostridia bacterium]|nr:hypothetical protein [Clostridia bacterium]
MRKNRENKEKVKTNKKESELVTKESLCAVCALFSLIALLILFTRSLIFGAIGVGVHSFLTGLFGYMAYPVFLGALYLSVTGLIGKRFVKNRRAGLWIALTVLSLALTVHIAATYSWDKSGYIASCFTAGASFPAATATGWLGALIAYPVFALTTKVGAIIIFSILTLFFGYLAFTLLKRSKNTTSAQKELDNSATVYPAQPVEIPLSQAAAPQATQPVQTAQPPVQNAYNAYGEVTVQQRPEVLLSDEVAQSAATDRQQTTGNAFSPFGRAENMRTEEETRTYENAREFLFGGTPAENYRRNLIFDPNANVNKRPSVDPSANPSVTSGYAPSYSDAYQSSVNDTVVERPTKIFTDYSNETRGSAHESRRDDPYSLSTEPTIEPMHPMEETPVVEQRSAYSPVEEVVEPLPQEEKGAEEEYRRHDYMDLFSPSNPNVFGNEQADRDFASETFARGSADESALRNETVFENRRDFVSERDVEEDDGRGRGIDIFDEKEEDPYSLRSDFDTRTFDRNTEEEEGASRFASEALPMDRGRDFDELRVEREAVKEPDPEPTPPPPPKPRVIRPYVRVPLDDFDCRDVEPTSNMQEVEETKANIIATLDDFKVTGASISSVTFGPTVTRYNVTIPRNISPRKVVALDQSIAISLHSAGVNIYPNYEDGVVSIEVPNKERQFVQLGCMLTGDTYVNAKSSSIMFTMGKDVGNRKVYGDISKMIHLLVAGSSGSGKSVFLGSLIISLIYKYSPEELRLILIDPKKTEFVLYNNLPHLMINEIITDVNKAVQSLNWAIGEMNRRYGLFEQMSRSGTYVVNLDDYNSHLDKAERLPKIVIIIDELADLMLAAKKDIEDRIQNLTQKARAAGIHLIVATQRPSIDVITGVIKSNLPTRIAFAVATDVDSRVILDQSGAQKLLGKGDFLYTMQGINTPVRVQSAFISAGDSQRVVNFIKQNNEAYYDESATAYINNTRSGDGGGSMGGGDEVEAVYIEALRFVILSGSASISMIQRKCSVGYNKAGKIVEWMEDMGYISSFDGAKARKVLITKEEFESKYGSL